jgi:hypothetical protein
MTDPPFIGRAVLFDRSGIRSVVKHGDQYINIPAKFWEGVRAGDIVGKGGGFNRRQCLRLWKMLKRTDPCPKWLPLFLDREDVMREFPEKKS